MSEYLSGRLVSSSGRCEESDSKFPGVFSSPLSSDSCMTLGRLVAGAASHAAASSKLRFEGGILTGSDDQLGSWTQCRIEYSNSSEVSKVYYENEV